MTMQIQTICLYGKNRKKREIDFKLGSVNIITGASNKGKTSLIDIIGYCLGDSECTIKAGRIPETVSWYSVLLQLSDCQVFIARAAPLDGIKSNSAAYMLTGHKVELPETHELTNTHNIDSIVDYLTYKLVTPKPPEGLEVKTSFDKSKYYLFQSQTEIANNDILFHHQTRPNVTKVIKDTLPYFIGAADDNYLDDIQKLASVKRAKAILVRQKKELTSSKNKALTIGHGILAEAVSVGLSTTKDLIPDEKALLVELEKLSQWPYFENQEKVELPNDNDPIPKLEKEYDRLSKNKAILLSRIREAKSYRDAESGYYRAVETQSFRLRSIGLFEKNQTTENCPICETQHTGESRIDDSIHNALSDLESKLTNINRTKPDVTNYLKNLETEKKKLISEQRKVEASLRKLRDADAELLKKAKEEISRAMVVGQCKLFLKDGSWNKDERGYINQIALLDEEIKKLSTELDPAILKERLNSKLNSIADDMTEWARDLKLEHSDGLVRLDPTKLSVVIDKADGPLSFSNVGGGKNWLGYNLVTHFALAKWFIEQARPVGNFLFLDQPSVGYFPNPSSGLGDLSEIEADDEREVVRAVFLWIFKIVKSLNSELQVIITDHADINEDWFQEAVIDNKWRGDYALIPKDWYE